MSEHSTTMAERVRWLMRASGLGVIAFSDFTRVARPSVWYLLHKGRPLSERSCRRLAEAFGASLDWMVYGKGPKPDLAVVSARAAEYRLRAA